MIQDNIRIVKKNIADICLQANRDANSVTLIAVSKTKPVTDIIEAFKAGIQHFGENYVQEAVSKIQLLKTQDVANKPIIWHYIGRLQSRKLALIAQYFDIVHSLDRIDHAQKLNEIAKRMGKTLSVFIQVNLDRETRKGGILAQDLPIFLESMQQLEQIDVLGLMLIPKPETDEAETLAKFQELKHLVTQFGGTTKGCMSMGMSRDYPLALQAGATHIRIGEAIFGERAVKARPER